ncbi:unnamed protein product [Polarella glacialis]|uniref:Uncharacterized protein n=1 Tax=Polarella glacialis TaxID=89957 RepID=A0A813LDN0_POLGL|nr:unnamed protein product [Polarella glacialis]
MRHFCSRGKLHWNRPWSPLSGERRAVSNTNTTTATATNNSNNNRTTKTTTLRTGGWQPAAHQQWWLAVEDLLASMRAARASPAAEAQAQAQRGLAALMGSLARGSQWPQALGIFAEFTSGSGVDAPPWGSLVVPRSVGIYSAALSAAGRQRCWESAVDVLRGAQLDAARRKSRPGGLRLDAPVYNSVITACGQCARWDLALALLMDMMPTAVSLVHQWSCLMFWNHCVSGLFCYVFQCWNTVAGALRLSTTTSVRVATGRCKASQRILWKAKRSPSDLCRHL